jgi:malonate-semialdehyde dehydrogenase (acetylating) / methylmalonate-semialdehyde dehydrogenase
MAPYQVKNYINGKFVESAGKQVNEVRNPCTDEVIATAPDSPASEVDAAADCAINAFKEWRRTPPQKRARILMQLKDQILKNHDEIAKTLTIEHGKTFAEAGMELSRAIDNIEVACHVTSKMMGHLLEDIAPGIDEFSGHDSVLVASLCDSMR